MSSPLISIIIPVHNAEKYLCLCLDSVLAQTYTNWECLLVDDGSKDSSGIICDEYAKTDSRFKVYHKENGGVSSARNLGIKEMSGEYVCFYDSDDLIPDYALSYLLDLFTVDCNSVFAGFSMIDKDGNQISIVRPLDSKVLCLEEALLSTYGVGTAWQGYLWNRLFKTSVIHKHKLIFDETLAYKEDGVFLIEYLTCSNTAVVYGSEVVYLYRQFENSAMGVFRSGFTQKMISNVKAHLIIINILEKGNCSNKLIITAYRNMYSCYHKVKEKASQSSDSRNNIDAMDSLLTQYLGHKKLIYGAIFKLYKLALHIYLKILK